MSVVEETKKYKQTNKKRKTLQKRQLSSHSAWAHFSMAFPAFSFSSQAVDVLWGVRLCLHAHVHTQEHMPAHTRTSPLARFYDLIPHITLMRINMRIQLFIDCLHFSLHVGLHAHR